MYPLSDGNNCVKCPGLNVYCPGCNIQNNDGGADTCPGPCNNSPYGGTVNGECPCPPSEC